MPSLPGFVADFVESRIATPARVVETETLAPALRRVRFQSDALAKRHADGKLDPGLYTVEFRTARNDMRHYTACSWDLAKGAFDVLFYKHGDGPGRSWADGLKVGDEPRALGPGSRVAIDPGADRHVVIGDETSIGNARAVIENANGARVEGVIACSKSTAELPKAAGAAFEPLIGQTQTAITQGLLDWLDRKGPDPGAIYYLTGNRETVTAVGQFLLKRLGVPRRSLHLRVHWAEGKAGL